MKEQIELRKATQSQCCCSIRQLDEDDGVSARERHCDHFQHTELHLFAPRPVQPAARRATAAYFGIVVHNVTQASDNGQCPSKRKQHKTADGCLQGRFSSQLCTLGALHATFSTELVNDLLRTKWRTAK